MFRFIGRDVQSQIKLIIAGVVDVSSAYGDFGLIAAYRPINSLDDIVEEIVRLMVFKRPFVTHGFLTVVRAHQLNECISSAVDKVLE